ncbi:MAG TPA: 50S ribosomal protein L10, partial [Alcanivorax sp.]|nr:50S ribosomal protein L10 [Alcanivorax sp.]
MPLNLEDKRAIVVSVNAAASEALSAVVADYRGLSVAEMTNLRLKARETGVYLKVVRNTLAKRAVAGTDYECLTDALVGPTVLA